MANFMKKQFLIHNNNAVENYVIIEQLKELSKGELSLDDPYELTSTNQLLKTLGLKNNNNNNQRRGGPRKKSNRKKYKK